MSILIRGMEMPKNEPLLVKINPDGTVSTTAKDGYGWHITARLQRENDFLNEKIKKKVFEIEKLKRKIKEMEKGAKT